ncbi:unnamed protein product [Lasius platythorax]|uniref:Uncharacterized protein n=1 Tax=Lasius platythorax TaxID=488582 RepID=A0AAV2N1F0_9HYME
MFALIRPFTCSFVTEYGARTVTSHRSDWPRPRTTLAAEVGFPNRLTSYPRESNYITRPISLSSLTVVKDKEGQSGQRAGKRAFIQRKSDDVLMKENGHFLRFRLFTYR